MSDSLEYVRKYYGVPAVVGGRIVFNCGGYGAATIVGGEGPHLRVRFDSESESDAEHYRYLHPTWNVEYLPPAVVVPLPPQKENEK